MNNKPAAIYFDTDDYHLLTIVQEVLEKGSRSKELRSLLVEHMHPHGIKEMAAPRGLRIAYAIASLLGSFEKGRARDRIRALRVVRDEVSLSSTSFYQKNTARVLLQIMKDLLRVKDNELRQLKLAHDFRMVSTGNPRLVRAELAKYYLLEMPEEWNQYAFDDRVHDANTKGRKSPTHLVMDAWIKGIRYLTVVYYNYVNPEVIEELIEASALLDLHVQVGIEMTCRFRDKYVRFTWEPHGFNDNRAFLKFLQEDAVKQLLEEGRKVTEYQQQYVFDIFDVFNVRHRDTLNRELQVSLEPLQPDAFLRFVGTGQPSLLHLGRFIHNTLITVIKKEVSALQHNANQPAADTAQQVERLLAQLQKMDVETLISRFLLPSSNPEVHDPSRPQDGAKLPDLLRLDLNSLLHRLLSLHSSSKFTLNLSNLSIQDTLEVLCAGEGMISHIEAYNLKNAVHGMTANSDARQASAIGEAVDLTSPERHYALISELQQALNEDNVISLKRVIRAIIWDHEEQRLRVKSHLAQTPPDKQNAEELLLVEKMQERKLQLMDILYHLEDFHDYYRKRTLGSRIGSGSTGQAEHQHGMGMVVLETLPVRAKKVAFEGIAQKRRSLIPVTGLLTKNSHTRCRDGAAAEGRSFWPGLPFFGKEKCLRWNDWDLDSFSVHPPIAGNIATLGGMGQYGENGKLVVDRRTRERLNHPWKYLNTNLKNSLKVALGFVPAFLTFALTKDWWLLAYFGAFIWFGITGTRNIIQSVLGGGGLRRSPLLPWNSLVSWSRIADSLLYTGFSVPLLDYLVKTLLLDRAFGITTATNPVLLYSVMGLANGIYISAHNTFRGLPRSAAVGNFFRSILAIPLAVLLNTVIGLILQLAGVPDISGVLQKWAAIISKFASDCVAAIIEGLADRQTNIRLRLAGYRTKITQLFAVFSRLDLQFPEEDVLEMLQSPKMMMQTLNYEAREQERFIIVNALDLMYFWMYQPRAAKALAMMVQEMTREEWLIFYRSQLVLNRHREVSQFFVDGLVGKNFAKALSFYLERSTQYLLDMEKIGARKKWHK